MNKLKKTVHDAFFWAGIIVITYLSCFLIFTSYNLILIKGAAAAEASSFVAYRPMVAISEVNDDQVDLQTETDFINCDCEKEFTNPVAVTWRGKVMATFVSGDGIGVEKYNYDDEYSMFYVITNDLYDGRATEIEVRGDLIGITCAYANTVFGKCVPLIQAQKIKNINIQ
ncbi:MAG: hypothetical protein ACOX0H_00910 [Patescibacteria group bacterium]|jgi:hypothetical protein|nr:hypothetical protein [bacterium]HQC49578.1 hypothetical protein [bacterium]